MLRWVRWSLIAFIVLIVGVAPYVYFRAIYAHSKRLRVVEPGKVYRSGQMTAAGFRDAIQDLGIRTVVNLQEDYPDPALDRDFFSAGSIQESELCRELGVRFLFIPLDLVRRRACPPQRPEGVEKMLAVFDNPANYPILLHCRAGLHRTGCMAAIYRMEFQDWSPGEAVDEMRRHGFGDSACTAANDYVYQYVLSYRPGIRYRESEARGQKSEVRDQKSEVNSQQSSARHTAHP